MNNSVWRVNLQRSLATLSMLVAVIASSATGRAQIASVNSYSLPANNTGMSNVVSTGGSIWFLSNINTGDGGYQYYLNSTTPSGVTTQYSLNSNTIPYPVGNSIAVGPDGALWFPAGQDGDGAIVRVTTSGTISTYPLTNPYVFVNGPGSITAGPNNDLWFTDPSSVSGAQIGRVTTAGTFSFFPVTNPAFGITLGPDGNLWATEYSRTAQESSGSYYWTGQVAKITPAGVETLYNMPQVRVLLSGFNETPLDTFATGSDGALWFTEYDGTQVGRVTTSGAVTTVYTGAADGITSGPDGALWLTQPSVSGNGTQTGGPALIQVQTGGTTNSYPLNSDVFENPSGIAVGPDSALWFNDSGAAVVGQAILKIVITTTQASVPNGSAGVAYPATTFQAEFGTTPYSWSAPATALPPGLTLSSAGVLSGTPTSSGTFSFTVTVTDSGSPAQTASAPFSITISAGAPASVMATSGSGQSATVNTAFGQALVATVLDSEGNPVPGASVTFSAPGTGASGTFAGATGTVTVAANTAGVATSPTFTANGSAGTYSVSASVPGATAASFTLTNNAGAAASITATSGSGQSAAIGSAFANPLVAKVTDSGGNPVANATVTFSAPGSGAGGTFAGGSGTATTTTNASGLATSPTFTANTSAGTYNVAATVAGVTGQATFVLTNSAGSPASIAVVSGSGQTTTVGTPFGTSLAAIVKDSGGNPVAGVSVTFAAPASGASGTFSGSASTTTSTNGAGVATAPAFVANATAGSYFVTAATAGVAAPASFALSNTAGPPASISVMSGSGQTAQINNTFGSALSVVVKDASGNPSANATVTFVAPGSGASGTFAGSGAAANATTGANGVAISPAFTANATAGTYTVNASVAGVANSASFALTNTAGAPARITVTSGANQSATVGSAFASLVATVRDSGGNPVANASVTFTAAPAGASGTFSGGSLTAVVQSNASGLATAPTFTANSIAGSYNVSAAVSGVGGQAIFPLTNNAGAAAIITVSSGNGQFAQVNTPYAMPLVALVTDANNNPVANVRVTFTAPNSGASCTFGGGGTAVSVTTNSSGLASTQAVPAKANGTAGAFNVIISASGVSSTASLALNNSAGAPGSITITSGSPQSVAVKAAFAPLVVLVEDSSGNAVANATVTFTAPGSGASGTFAGAGTTATATTNSSGSATAPIFTANGTAGSYLVTASVSGAASPATFSLTNNAGTPASIAASTGTPQTARVNTAFNNPLVVKVSDTSGNAIGGVSVTYTAPGSGASGTFAGGGATATALTNSSGIATSPVFTANGTTGSYNVAATVSGVGSAADFALTNVAGLTITTAATLPAGTAGLQYSEILGVAAGTPPYNWTLSHGTLPAGLTLNASTGAISGIPTAAGNFPFTVSVTDSSAPAQSASQAFSLYINPPVTQPVLPGFTFNGVPATQAPGTSITGATIQLSPASSAAFAGTLTLGFTPNAAYASGLPDGYTGDAGFVSSTGAKSTSEALTIPAATTSVPLPSIDPGTVAGDVTVNLAVGGQNTTTATVTVPASAPVIEANSVQITNVTSSGFNVELVATSTTRELTTATFTFNAAAGATLNGTSFTVDVSSLLSQWFAGSTSLPYGGAFTLTIPFTLTGSANAIESVSVTVSNTIGTSTPVSGTQ